MKIMKKFGKNIVAFPLKCCFGFLNKWFKFRFGALLYNRIGHFAGDAILYDCEEVIRNQKNEWFFYTGGAANKTWEKVFLRNKKTIKNERLIWLIKNFLLSSQFSPTAFRPTHYNETARDNEGLHLKVEHRLRLNHEENNEAIHLLKKTGWNNQPIVVLHVRDDAYLKNDPNNTCREGNWDYHSYRDSDIKTYKKAVESLIQKGYFVYRVGKYTNLRMPIVNPMFIDLWHDGFDNDLLDIWLSMNCQFMISTGSGIDILSAYSRIPVLMVNFMPISAAWTFCHNMVLSKNLYWEETGKQLTLKELYENSFHLAKDYRDRKKIGRAHV